MSHEQDFETHWKQPGFTVPGPPQDICSYAGAFQEWVSQKVADLGDRPELDEIDRAMLQLLDKYYEWRVYVPKSHRFRMGEKGHRCIFHVFDAGYQKIKSLHLAHSAPVVTYRPQLALPAPQPPPVQITGIFLGEDDNSGA